jgi:hypothetical protein
MIYSPETNITLISTSLTNEQHLNILKKRSFEDAHSVHAGSSSSRLTLLSFFLLLHVASFLAES